MPAGHANTVEYFWERVKEAGRFHERISIHQLTLLVTENSLPQTQLVPSGVELPSVSASMSSNKLIVLSELMSAALQCPAVNRELH
mmetsp:Transcript_23330/g.37567  ORF Transcript_23330/g.37567 Transcript_23330/m.37567 type:complete len:86 (-) Transcript_23330:91-348(-)